MLIRIQACLLAFAVSASAADLGERPQINGPAVFLRNITQQVNQVKIDHPVEYPRVEERLKTSFVDNISTELNVPLSTQPSVPFEVVAVSTFANLFTRREEGWTEQITRAFESYNNQLPVIIEQALQSVASSPQATGTPIVTLAEQTTETPIVTLTEIEETEQALQNTSPQQIEDSTPVRPIENLVTAPVHTSAKVIALALRYSGFQPGSTPIQIAAQDGDLVTLFTNVITRIAEAREQTPEIETELTRALFVEMHEADNSLLAPQQGKSFEEVMNDCLKFFEKKYKQEVLGHVVPALKRFNDNFPAHKEKALREVERVRQQLKKTYEQSAPRVEKALDTGFKSLKKDAKKLGKKLF